MSKKYFHQHSPEWLNDPKIKIKIEDANKYVLDLDKNIQYDAILMVKKRKTIFFNFFF